MSGMKAESNFFFFLHGHEKIKKQPTAMSDRHTDRSLFYTLRDSAKTCSVYVHLSGIALVDRLRVSKPKFTSQNKYIFHKIKARQWNCDDAVPTRRSPEIGVLLASSAYDRVVTIRRGYLDFGIITS